MDRARANAEQIKELLPLAKSPRERTEINIVLDDQKKVIKSMERLLNDLLEKIKD